MNFQQLILLGFLATYSLTPNSSIFKLSWNDVRTLTAAYTPRVISHPQFSILCHALLSLLPLRFFATAFLLAYTFDTYMLRHLILRKVWLLTAEFSEIVAALELIDPSLPPLLAETYNYQKYIVVYDIDKHDKAKAEGNQVYYVDFPRVFCVRRMAEQALLNVSVKDECTKRLHEATAKAPWHLKDSSTQEAKPNLEPAELCAICFDDLVPEDHIIQLNLCCRKIFHANCFCYWLGILEMPVEPEPEPEPEVQEGTRTPPPQRGIRDFWNRLRQSITRLNDDLPRMVDDYLNVNPNERPRENERPGIWENLRRQPRRNLQRELVTQQRKIEVRQHTILYLVKKCPLCAHLYLLDANQFYNHQYAFYNKAASPWKEFLAQWQGQGKNMEWGGKHSMCFLFAHDFINQYLMNVSRDWAPGQTWMWLVPDWVAWNVVVVCICGWIMLVGVGLYRGSI
ncbi:hypothetical protein BABINDRAFT_163951 [Babjeviella inositovora NRRL Y-12698]|uniref:RING-type domain-containing protein n=1 Tax=Babjeviella inositovora NRRL Y-12698 TaxID=984486 RepID=A0A1E3QGX6_9ASCO|nr:uncharacterized protein BABINDRAFT_163951 [Babjeviella inositovora NRRL Y-12698]ODQ76949.1 hypothetical protein BABINDRAFT_163951 [Babjeviella inositovora NRRL Y-12698]